MSLRIFQLVNLKKGFSLPIFVAACAKAAVKKLLGHPFQNYEMITVPDIKDSLKIKVYSSGFISQNSIALAISFVDSGLSLDLTQNLEIWTKASFIKNNTIDKPLQNRINIKAGDGVGKFKDTSNICISKFALDVLNENLLDIIPLGSNLEIEIIFPRGKFLAERTSNKSFGVVDGLSIIGTTAETYISASPEQLNESKSELSKILANHHRKNIIFVIGENGLDLAKNINHDFPIIKVGNWLGPMLVEAAIKNVKGVILLGYHGKLIKLAGGIFNTHNHLADARIEILVYLAIEEKVPIEIIYKFYKCSNIEDALIIVEGLNAPIAEKLWIKIANKVESKTVEYLMKYSNNDLQVGAALFDKNRKIRWLGTNGKYMFKDAYTIKS